MGEALGLVEPGVKVEGFARDLRRRGMSEHTIESYTYVARFFEQTYGEPDEACLHAYRTYLVDRYKPGTVNQRIQAINCYLGYLGRDGLRQHTVRVQQHTYLDEMLSDEEYRRLVDHLYRNEKLRDYHAVRLMATTGMRVGELLRVSIEDLRIGYVNMSSKGKVRRIHFPNAPRVEALNWAEGEGRREGPLLLNRYGMPISARGLSLQLKTYAAECGISQRRVHPHAFRHLFARKFLEAGGDIAFLADLLGHSSVDTTRIYLRRTAMEQQSEVNRLVCW